MQSILMGVAIVTVTIAAVTQSGGLTAAWEKARAAGRLTVLDERTPLLQSLMSPSERHSLSNLLAGGTLIYCSLYGVNQTQVQRLLTIKSLSKARLALVIAWPVTSLLSLACCAVYVVTKLRTTIFVLSTLFALCFTFPQTAQEACGRKATEAILLTQSLFLSMSSPRLMHSAMQSSP